MKIYGISGLGADKRVFKYLNLNYDLIPIDWIKPKRNESIENYSQRLSEVIDTNSDFGLLGVSFGGLIAVEINKLLNPRLTILISSVETKNELRSFYKFIGKTGLIKLLPSKAFDPPRRIANLLFGTDNKNLLNDILNDTNLEFAKWAVNELMHWQNEEKSDNLIKIGGTKDKIIPSINDNKTILMKNGEHFMIVDKADEISSLINKKIKTHSTTKAIKHKQGWK